MDRLEQKQAFIKQLAKFLVDDQVGKGVALRVEKRHPGLPGWANDWAALRATVPGLIGYPTLEEAEKILQEFLG